MSRYAARLAVSLLLLGGGVASAVAATFPHGDRAKAATTTTLVTSPAATVVGVSGHGWGHGLGLSQWGAYGYALHGLGFERILAHYYPGTTLGPAPGRTVRVLVASGKRLTFTAAAPLQVNGNLYRGRISVSVVGKLLRAIDAVGLESYLRDVVPAEVPSAWPAVSAEKGAR